MMRRVCLLATVALALLPAAAAARPVAHAAAVCADFPNQAAAQRAHNTRDADGDGIYCEALPCPCLKPGQGGGGTPKPHKQRRARPKAFHPGHSHRLGTRTQNAGCQFNGLLPDPQCSPGAVFSNAKTRDICRSGYSRRVRHVTQATKDAVFAEYGIASHAPGQYEVDHLVPLEAGGSNDIANLFPEAAPGFHEKDRLENAEHRDLCDGQIGLRSAERGIARDWTQLYTLRFGSPPGQ